MVGYLGPLSGPDRAAGEHAWHGIELAVEEANQEGNRVNNRPVNVVQKDVAGDADKPRDQTVELATIRRCVALLGATDPGQLEQIGRAAEPYSLPLLSPAPLAGPAGDYVFSTAVPPAEEGQVLGRFAREVLKPAGVLALADDRSRVSGAVAASFLQEVGQADAVKAGQATYKGEADFPEAVARAKKARPKAVLVAGSAPDLAKLGPQLHAAVAEATLLFATEDGSVPSPRDDPAGLGTAYAAGPFATEALTDKGRQVAKQYRDRFGQDLDAHAALAYDDARLLFEAMRRARGTSSLLVRKELLGLENFETLTGPLSFTKEHTARRAVFVLRLEGGKAQLAKRYDPGSR